MAWHCQGLKPPKTEILGTCPKGVPSQEATPGHSFVSAEMQGDATVKVSFYDRFRLQNSLRTNPTRLLLITGALGQWCLNVLQDLDLSYIIYSHLPGKTLILEEVLGSANA